MLKVENLTKIYDGGTQALDDVSFEVEKGEFLAVIGLSGSGKSTLLRCINRLIEPTSGTITWAGVDVTTASQEDLRRIRRRIGMVFQHFNLVSRSKVLTNVLAGRLGYLNPALSVVNRFPRADIEKAHAQLARVGLEEKAGARADELSGGQQQRVGVARAMMQDPEIMLADEPVASLDPVLAHSIMQYLELINDEDGVTVNDCRRDKAGALRPVDGVDLYALRPGLVGNRIVDGLQTGGGEHQGLALHVPRLEMPGLPGQSALPRQGGDVGDYLRCHEGQARLAAHQQPQLGERRRAAAHHQAVAVLQIDKGGEIAHGISTVDKSNSPSKSHN